MNCRVTELNAPLNISYCVVLSEYCLQLTIAQVVGVFHEIGCSPWSYIFWEMCSDNWPCFFPWYFSRSVFEDALRVYGMAHREALRTRRWIPERFCYQALLRYLIWSFHVDVIPVTSQSILSFVNACKQPIQNLVLPEVVLLGFLLELRQINAIFGITLLGFLSSARCVN